MHSILFLKGLAVGLIISIPLGPMAIICIRRTLQQGYLYGLLTSIGVAIGDSIYATIAGFSVNYIIDQIKEYQYILSLISGIIITLLGISLFVSHSTKAQKDIAGQKSLFRTLYTAILLTLSNPINLLAFIALFSWIKATPGDSVIDTLLIVLGVFIGAIIWFNILSILFGLLRTKLTPKIINNIHKLTGSIIIILGIVMMLKGTQS